MKLTAFCMRHISFTTIAEAPSLPLPDFLSTLHCSIIIIMAKKSPHGKKK